MTISDEAVEAAAKAAAKEDAEPNWYLETERFRDAWRIRMRAALEAAAPFIRAEALEEAANEMDRMERIGDIPFRVSDEEEAAYATYVHHPDMRSWLRARAAEMRQG